MSWSLAYKLQCVQKCTMCKLQYVQLALHAQSNSNLQYYTAYSSIALRYTCFALCTNGTVCNIARNTNLHCVQSCTVFKIALCTAHKSALCALHIRNCTMYQNRSFLAVDILEVQASAALAPSPSLTQALVPQPLSSRLLGLCAALQFYRSSSLTASHCFTLHHTITSQF